VLIPVTAAVTGRLARSSAIVVLFQVALDKLTAIPAGDPKLQARLDVLRTAVRRYAQGARPAFGASGGSPRATASRHRVWSAVGSSSSSARAPAPVTRGSWSGSPAASW